VNPVVVTVIATEIVRPFVSANFAAQVPAPEGVTVNVAAGPAPVFGVTEAIDVQVSFSLKAPV
jgi:hypothetical protein